MTMFSFDYYDQSVVPNFTLCNPDETPLFNLGTITDRKFELRYNTQSTLTFTAPSKTGDDEDTDYYDWLEYRRLVFVENIGNFMITDIEIDNDGIIEKKNVTCKSLEVIMSYKMLSISNKQYYFYSPSLPTYSLMDLVLSYIPGWTLGTIDSSLYNINRGFDFSSKSLYDFLINDVSQTYQCVFVFDSINKTISAYSLANATTPSDIYISFDNLMKSFTISESTEELVTALDVIGGEDLSINLVNPLGTNTIYNFDYYKTTNWMTQDLIDALDAWEAKVAFWQPTYANYLTSLRQYNADLVSLQSSLVTLQGELAALTVVKDARIQQGLSTTEISASMVVVSGSITTVTNEITTTSGSITTIQAQLSSINSDLDFESTSNFSAAELANLNNFIIGNTYTNTNIIQTSIMTEYEVQVAAQLLYDQARGVWNSTTQSYDGGIISKISQPRYTFDIDSANFLFIKDFEPFIEEIQLGNTITIQLRETSGSVTSGSTSGLVTAVLLGLDFNYDNPSDFKMVLSNRLRLDDEQFQYSDLFGSMADAATSTNANSLTWNNVASAYNALTSAGQSFVVSSTTSSASNIALFDGISGSMIRDAGAMYVASGSYSPTLYSVGATFTYDYNYGNYSIIGRTLFFESSISLAGVSGTTSNAVYLTIPPANHKNSTNISAQFIPACNGISYTGYTQVYGLLPNSGSLIALYKQGEGIASTALLASNTSASSVIHLSGMYAID